MSSFQLPSQLAEQLKLASMRLGLNVDALMMEALQEWLDRNDAPKMPSLCNSVIRIHRDRAIDWADSL
ncbi:hypothetical protein [Oryzifoliimicrobium ureilyticus]|uniref:hypothetical protein n=1 Tax=Oryzifoliimicrobium ureilyticus TaxID=3113724 RepID=UPI0030764A60